MPASKEKLKIKVGQWVYVPFGESRLKARVLEDYGLIGYEREQYFLVLIVDEELGEETRPVAESRLTPA